MTGKTPSREARKQLTKAEDELARLLAEFAKAEKPWHAEPPATAAIARRICARLLDAACVELSLGCPVCGNVSET